VYQQIDVTAGAHGSEGQDFVLSRAWSRGGITLQLLGSFRVRVGARLIQSEDWDLRKGKAVVKLLALSDRHRMHRGELMHLLWPERSSEAASNNLHKALHVVRHMLEPGLRPRVQSSFLQMHGDFVYLTAPDGIQTDVEAFTAAARLALSTRDGDACRQALSLYGGDLLPEDRYEDWTIALREELAILRFNVLMCLGQAEANEGNLERAIAVAQEAIDVDPLNEEAHSLLIHLLAQIGQRHLALRQYERLRALLREELGIEPDESTRAALRQIMGNACANDHPACPYDGAEMAGTDTGAFPLLGRQAEVARLEQILDELSDGDGGLVVLRGADGIGKSSVVHVLAHRAEQLGTRVAWLSGRLSRAFAAAAALGDPLGMAALVVVDDPEDEDLAARIVRDALARGTDRPVVLMTLPRDRSTESKSILQQLADEATSHGSARVVELGPLDDASVERMIRTCIGGRISPQVIGWIRDTANGNPHYVQEAIGAVLGRGIIHQTNGCWTFTSAGAPIERDALRRPVRRASSAPNLRWAGVPPNEEEEPRPECNQPERGRIYPVRD
jgi:DNA-binding SARP family transcriptional activator